MPASGDNVEHADAHTTTASSTKYFIRKAWHTRDDGECRCAAPHGASIAEMKQSAENKHAHELAALVDDDLTRACPAGA